MKKTFLFSLALLGGISFLPSCKKEQAPPLTQANQTTKSSKKVAATNLLTDVQLATFSKISVPGFLIGTQVFSSANNATELITPYQTASGATIMNLTIADLGFYTPAELDNYLSGINFALSSDVPPITSLTIALSNPTTGFALDATSGDPTAMALSTGYGNAGLFSTPLSLPTDGSYVKAYSSTTDPNIAGWVVFDGTSKGGFVLLLVSNRFAVVVDGIGQTPALSNVYRVLSQFDFANLELLSNQ